MYAIPEFYRWRRFDFFIVFACYFFLLPFMAANHSLVSMLRLLRLLRVLKLVRALPQLRIIIEALMAGFGSIFFVVVIQFMVFYVFANVGMLLFSTNDPARWSNLQNSLTTLFRMSCYDNWSDIL